MPSSHVPMEGRALPREFTLGPLRFTDADQFPLEEIYCNVDENEIVLRLSGHFDSASPWRGSSMVVFFLYRLPDGEAAFQEEVERYRKDAQKKTVKLPDKQPFDQSVLDFNGVAELWDRDCFAAGPRNLFQVYQSGGAAILVRWSSQRGTMLDHPLLGLVRDSVQLVDRQWQVEIPQTVQSGSTEFADDEEDEFQLVTNVDLREAQERVRTYVEQRVAGYLNQENFGPGEPTDPIGLITLGFYAEQTGYIAIVFDTRPDAFLVVEEFDGRYFWPTYETRKTEGAIGG